MPCGDGIQYRTDPQVAEDLRRATRAACDMRTILRRNNLLDECTQETLRWVRRHDEEDARRIEIENRRGIRERARLRALRKLSLEERRALGL